VSTSDEEEDDEDQKEAEVTPVEEEVKGDE